MKYMEISPCWAFFALPDVPWESLSNEWTTLAHVWFGLQILVHLQKEQCESEPYQKNK